MNFRSVNINWAGIIFSLTLSISLCANSLYGDEKMIQNSDVSGNANSFGDHQKKSKDRNKSPSGPQCLKGPKGPTGPIGPTGPTGTYSSSYGRLNLSTTASIFFDVANTWKPVIFNSLGPVNNIRCSSTTMTMQQTGIYQLNVSLYFSSNKSVEGTFTPTTYTLGMGINGNTPVSCAAVYAGEQGFFSLNFSDLLEFSTNDYIRFFLQSSIVGGDVTYDNPVTLESGNASIVQIAN